MYHVSYICVSDLLRLAVLVCLLSNGIRDSYTSQVFVPKHPKSAKRTALTIEKILRHVLS